MTTSKKKYQPNIHGKIAKLIAERQADINALMRAGALLNGVAKNGKVGGHASLLAEAVALDTERRQERGPYKKHKPAKPASKYDADAVQARRKATAKFLAKVKKSGDTPFIPTGKDQGRVSVLIQHKYLKPKDGGYVTTEKTFTA